MARIRTIKPEFPQSESMGNISRDARLTFILLWTLVDDSGRARGNSRLLANLLFPYDEDAATHIEEWLRELENEGCIVRYTVAGKNYLQVLNWRSHQRIDKPTKSKFPSFEEKDDDSSETREDSTNPREDSTNPRESSCEDLRIKGSEDQGSKDQGSTLSSTSLPLSAFADAWNEKARTLKEEGYSYSEVAKLTDARKKKLRARLKDPQFVDTFMKGVQMLPIKQWADWVPDFDWMIANDSNAISLVEGKYHKKTYTQGDRNASIIDEWEPGELTKEIFGDGQDKDTPAIDADSVRRIPARTDA